MTKAAFDKIHEGLLEVLDTAREATRIFYPEARIPETPMPDSHAAHTARRLELAQEIGRLRLASITDAEVMQAVINAHGPEFYDINAPLFERIRDIQARLEGKP